MRRSPSRWPSPTAVTWRSGRRRSACRCTAGSGSPGSTRPTCTSSGPRPTRWPSARRTRTGRPWPGWPTCLALRADDQTPLQGASPAVQGRVSPVRRVGYGALGTAGLAGTGRKSESLWRGRKTRATWRCLAEAGTPTERQLGTSSPVGEATSRGGLYRTANRCPPCLMLKAPSCKPLRGIPVLQGGEDVKARRAHKRATRAGAIQRGRRVLSSPLTAAASAARLLQCRRCRDAEPAVEFVEDVVDDRIELVSDLRLTLAVTGALAGFADDDLEYAGQRDPLQPGDLQRDGGGVADGTGEGGGLAVGQLQRQPVDGRADGR